MRWKGILLVVIPCNYQSFWRRCSKDERILSQGLSRVRSDCKSEFHSIGRCCQLVFLPNMSIRCFNHSMLHFQLLVYLIRKHLVCRELNSQSRSETTKKKCLEDMPVSMFTASLQYLPKDTLQELMQVFLFMFQIFNSNIAAIATNYQDSSDIGSRYHEIWKQKTSSAAFLGLWS